LDHAKDSVINSKDARFLPGVAKFSFPRGGNGDPLCLLRLCTSSIDR